eukprot:CAMPEP_0182593948 /NCGR_PEP_ID=MMETSP1324-20130603/79135_1 /TAXON_ID=236786 /ORGANISM="Florenciella sp., Strain RCC1587" /LENGTH=69 /DNA_ID=CAMNT_0024811451 /DNA_START=21 /DNA_END=226 /DNA_ORIENTATION=-
MVRVAGDDIAYADCSSKDLPQRVLRRICTTCMVTRIVRTITSSVVPSTNGAGMKGGTNVSKNPGCFSQS